MRGPDPNSSTDESLRPSPASAVLLAGFALIASTILWRWRPLAADYLSSFDRHASILFQLDYLLLAIFLAMLLLILAGADLRRDSQLVFVGLIGGAIIETWGTHTGLWRYYTGEAPPLWILPAWPTAALAIDRITRIFLRVCRRVPHRFFLPAARLTFGGFFLWMLVFTWPTTHTLGTLLALTLVAGLVLRHGEPRRAFLTFAAGASLGLFLERWGTTRGCWIYYTGATPPPFAVVAHGMAALAFWRAAELQAAVGRSLRQAGVLLRSGAARRAGLALLTLGVVGALVPALDPPKAEASRSGQSAGELINGVNQLRASYGMASYKVDPILMAVAEAQNNYSISIGEITHYGPDGSRPRDQAIAAGYGAGATIFVSENIAQGTGLSPSEAVEMWTGDDPHLNTMIGANYRDVGAAAGESDGVYYYTLLAGYVAGVGSANSSAPVASPFASTGAGAVSFVIPATPQEDGSIVHTVQAGQTLWTIAAVYNVPLDQLRKLNNLAETPLLHPGDRLIIQAALATAPPKVTQTSTAVTPRPELPTPPLATRTPAPTATSPPGKPPLLPSGPLRWGLIGLALLLIGAGAFLGLRRPS